MTRHTSLEYFSDCRREPGPRFAGSPTWHHMYLRTHSQKPLHHALVALSLCLFAVGPTAAEPIQSVRCAGNLISPGELRLRVLHACGAPDDRVDYRQDTFVHESWWQTLDGRGRIATYSVLFEDPRLSLRARQVIGAGLHDHETMLRALYDVRGLYRGEGAAVRRHLGHSPLPGPHAQTVWICRHEEEEFEEWTYNRGPTQFLRVLTFRNGRLVRLEFPGYGW